MILLVTHHIIASFEFSSGVQHILVSKWNEALGVDSASLINIVRNYLSIVVGLAGPFCSPRRATCNSFFKNKRPDSGTLTDSQAV